MSIGSTATANNANLSVDARLTTINKAMLWRSPSASAACLNGGTVASGAGFTPNGVGTHYDIGTNGAGNLAIFGFIRRMWFGTVLPTNAVMQAFTT